MFRHIIIFCFNMIFNLSHRHYIKSTLRSHLTFTKANHVLFAYGKKTTIRLGHKKYKYGPLTITVNGTPNYLFNLEIFKVIKKRFGDLTEADAVLDGFIRLSELKAELQRCYGRPINPTEPISQIFIRHYKIKGSAQL